jgi:hypothetical protein
MGRLTYFMKSMCLLSGKTQKPSLEKDEKLPKAYKKQ